MLRFSLFCMATIFAANLLAQDAPSAEEYRDPMPASVESVDLAKGGKLVGRISKIGAGKITFNDDTLGDVDLKPEQIGSLNSTRAFDVFFQRTRRSEMEMGKVTIDGGNLRFDGGDFATGDMYRMSDSKFSLWNRSGSVSTSLAYSDGNTEELAYGLYANLKYSHPVHEFNFAFSGTYGETNGVRTSQRWYFLADYRHFVSEKVAIFAREELDHDDFADRNIRSVTSLGVSYDAWANNDMTLRFEGGLTYTIDDLEAGKADNWAGVMAGAYYNWRIAPSANFYASTVANQSLKDSDQFSLRNRAGLSQTLWGNLTSALLFEHDYDNRPSPGLKRNDFRAVFLLGWTF